MRAANAAMLLVACLALGFCPGCGRDKAGPYVAPTVPVSGKITYKGQPLTGGSVTFEPEDVGREAHGLIQSDGTYVLWTFGENDGAVLGTHRVALSADARAGRMVPDLKYRNPSSSQILVDVSEGKTDYPISLE